jgi:hypothetical protein
MCTKPFSIAELDQLAALAALPDEEIDTVDIPEAPDENWALARRRPIAEQDKKRDGERSPAAP